MVRQKRLSADAERHRMSRKLENKEDSKNRKKRDALRHRSRRQRVESFVHVGMDSIIVSYGYLGRMDCKCRHCGALHFKCEIASGRKDEYKQCCHYGSVELPPLLPYPDRMKVLLQAADVDGRNFREHVRNYNSALAFASLGAQINAPTTREPYCFRIHGQINQQIGALHPCADQRPQYDQLYILDSTLTLQERMVNVGNYRCNETIMKMLGNVLTRTSPFAVAFKIIHEVEKEEIRRYKGEKRAPGSVRMIFDNNYQMRDQRRCNLPRANEVAMVFIGDNGEV
ncbi:unnamed protein product [Rotaria magnacalcarata]|uniref:Helitron helicase-like domain-containing protein n=1 Tax=Rotaria magnacalcarata TaxID=392030 RepID=A0A816LTP3_9BILA|nr:unnamed protein product [Rotaria magnacalcarata]CAF4142480.1 unnamed protein product [Rotaria magnacalcarata]